MCQTQRHVVENVGETVEQELVRVDEHALRWLIEREASRLHGCWAECEGAFDVLAFSGNSLRRAETELFEPALTYFDFGSLRGSLSGVAQLSPCLARTRLLLGGRTALCADAEAQSNSQRPGEPTGCEAEPRHASLELCEPKGPLYVGRTYFLSSGTLPPPTSPPQPTDALVESEESAPFQRPTRLRAHAAVAAAVEAAEADFRVAHSDSLQGLYGALWTAVREIAIRGGAAVRMDEGELASELAGEVRRRAVEARLPVGEGWEAQVRASIAFVDLLGRPDESAASKVGPVCPLHLTPSM